MGTLKPQGNGPLYSSTVIDWYTTRSWVRCYIWYSGLRPRPVPSSLYQM